MATKRIDPAQDIYGIKVTLLGTKPPIWRRLLVPASMTLAKLHDVRIRPSNAPCCPASFSGALDL
jgi:hypothetical protein